MKSLLLLMGVGFGSILAQESAHQQRLFLAEPATKQVVLTGFTRARASQDLTVEEAGRCLSVALDVGETLPENGVFAQLDGTFLRLDLQLNENEMARLDNQVAYLEKETRRLKTLLEQLTIPDTNYDQMLQQLEQSKLERVKLATQRSILQERYNRFTLKGPPGWRVTKRFLEPGQWVAQGATVARLGDFRRLNIPFSLDHLGLQWLRNHSGPITLNLTDEKLQVEAKVRSISPAFDEVTRKTEVMLEIESGMPRWRGGIRVEWVMNQAMPGVFVLNGAAVERRYDAHWVTREDGTRLRVEWIGESPDGVVRIKSPDLTAGQRFFGRKDL